MTDRERSIERIGQLEMEKAREYLNLVLPPEFSDPPPLEWLSTDQAADMVGRSKSWLIKRKDQFGGRQDGPGCKVEWPRRVIERYLQAHEVVS